MQIHLCDDASASRWDHFVGSVAGGWHYHLYGWKGVIEQAYGHKCFYLMAESGGSLHGILPLALIQSRMFGRSLTSLPFVDTAGIVATDDQVIPLLVEAAESLARQHKVDYLELRQETAVPGDFRIDTHKVSLTLPLPDSEERLWNSIPSERRNRVRKARNASLVAELRGIQSLDEFYAVWSRNMRDIGSPAHSRAFFEHVLLVFKESAKILVVREGDDCVGAAILLHYKRSLSVPWVSSRRDKFAAYPNDLLYWEAMKVALSQGLESFDFGRSSLDSGHYTYKLRWGAVARPVYWEYLAIESTQPTLPGADNPWLRLATVLWRKLPLTVANRLGPVVRKNITS